LCSLQDWLVSPFRPMLMILIKTQH
jgi:hypothetical protein